MVPTRRLIILVLAAAPLFLAGALIKAFVGLGVLYVMALVTCVLGDALIRPRRKRLVITRRMPERISLGMPTRVVFEIRNESRRSLDIHLAENLPPELSADPVRLHLHLAGGQKAELAYQLSAHKRGRFSLGDVFVLLGYMARFARYHLPLLVLLSDPRIGELAGPSSPVTKGGSLCPSRCHRRIDGAQRGTGQHASQGCLGAGCAPQPTHHRPDQSLHPDQDLESVIKTARLEF